MFGAVLPPGRIVFELIVALWRCQGKPGGGAYCSSPLNTPVCG